MYKIDRNKSFGKHRKRERKKKERKKERKKESIAKEIKWPQLQTFRLFFNFSSPELMSLNLSLEKNLPTG